MLIRISSILLMKTKVLLVEVALVTMCLLQMSVGPEVENVEDVSAVWFRFRLAEMAE